MPEVDLKRDVVDAAVNAIYQDFRVALTGVVRSFAASTSRAVVRFVVRFTGTDMKPHDEPDAQDVQVIHQSGDGYGFWHDVAKDDPVVVLAQDGAPFGFYNSGQPAQSRTGGASHTYGCAVAFPGGRVSSAASPTPPPNAPGEAVLGGGDLTSAVVFRRAGGPSPAELGTIVVIGANPIAGVKLGGDDATLGVARLTDPCAASTEAGTLLSALAAFANGIAPGTVPPPMLAAALAHLADISGASQQVASK